MSNIKTAISIEKSLFEQAQTIAREMKMSRSRLFALALQDYIQHRRNAEILDRINEAYADETDPGEQKRLRRMRVRHRQIVEGEW